MTASGETTGPDLPIKLGLFILSAAILALEVLHARVLSVQMWYHHAFVVVTMAMLGFAAAGTLVTVWPRLTRGNVGATMAWAATLFGFAVTAGHLLLTRTADAVTTVSAGGEFGLLAIAFSLLMVPYILGGIVVTLALSTGGKIHARYFVNLLGSALGAWLFIALIGPLQGERLLVLCAAAGPFSALFFAGKARLPRAVAALSLVGAAFLFVGAEQHMSIELGLGKRRHIQGELVARHWTPLCRLDLYGAPEADREALFLLQDGAAGTFMFSKDHWDVPSLLDTHAVAYGPLLRRLKDTGVRPNVLVIGVGGGTDLRQAMAFGAESVLGIEINAGIIDLLRSEFADFNGHLLEQPGVTVMEGEGRSTLRRLDRTFDLIQLAGADTYTAGMIGSFVLSESYLYTTEAVRDYFDHLNPGGTLGVIRAFDEPDRETLRFFGMALLELRRRGVERPSEHAAVIRAAWAAGTLFSVEPLSAQDIAAYQRIADSETAGLHSVIYLPGSGATHPNEFTRLAEAIDHHTEDAFFANYGVDVRPVDDDSPFFFNFHHVWDAGDTEDSAYARAMDSRIPIAPSILRALLLQCTVLVLLLVVLPLWLRRRRGLRSAGSVRQLTFFAAVGAGFMLLEISSVQRLALFLGHPTYSLTVVLFSFLFFAGLGSLWSGRFLRGSARQTRMALAVLVLLIAAFTLLLDVVTAQLLGLPLAWRIAVAVGCLAPMNFMMGLPFPQGLARLRAVNPELVAWAIGANGGAGVIASVLAIIVAMETGFTTVAVLALACYALALLATGPDAPDAAPGAEAQDTAGGADAPR